VNGPQANRGQRDRHDGQSSGEAGAWKSRWPPVARAAEGGAIEGHGLLCKLLRRRGPYRTALMSSSSVSDFAETDDAGGPFV